MFCPFCASSTSTRTSRAETATYRSAEVHCRNADCAARFGVGVEITHIIFAGFAPDAATQLRTSPPRGRSIDPVAAPANDDDGSREVLLPANDDDVGVDEAIG